MRWGYLKRKEKKLRQKYNILHNNILSLFLYLSHKVSVISLSVTLTCIAGARLEPATLCFVASLGF